MNGFAERSDVGAVATVPPMVVRAVVLACLGLGCSRVAQPTEVSPATPDPFARARAAFLDLRFGMFLHFNMGTFTDEEWATPNGDPTRFAPTALDCGQWADAAVAAGMKYVVLTTKHHDGFALWNSAVSDYDVGSSTWRDGRGDVVRDFVAAARARGLAIGLYYSIWDRTNHADVPFIEAQLRELLVNYGPIELLWFDGWGWRVGYTAVPYQELHDFVKHLQPDVLIVENNHEKSLTRSDVVEFERNVDGFPTPGNTTPTEVADNIRNDGTWFFSTTGACNLKARDTLLDSLTAAHAGAANYLLDVTPDRRGMLPDCQVSLLGALR